MMSRFRIALTALVALCLTLTVVGCEGSTTKTGSIEQPSDPVSVARQLYGLRLVTAAPEPASPNSLVVKLDQGEPADRDLFVLLAAMSEVATLPSSYMLEFDRGHSGAYASQRIYVWDPAAQTITWEDRDFGGSIGTAFYRGRLANVETETVAAIAAGDADIPEWERWRNAEPLARQPVDARGSVGKSLLLTVTIASDQLVAESDQLGVVTLENLGEKSRTIDYPSMGIRITDSSGTLVADYPAPRIRHPVGALRLPPYQHLQKLIRFTAPDKGSYLLYGYADDYQTQPISLVTTDVEDIVDKVGILRPIPGTEDGSAP